MVPPFLLVFSNIFNYTIALDNIATYGVRAEVGLGVAWSDQVCRSGGSGAGVAGTVGGRRIVLGRACFVGAGPLRIVLTRRGQSVRGGKLGRGQSAGAGVEGPVLTRLGPSCCAGGAWLGLSRRAGSAGFGMAWKVREGHVMVAREGWARLG